MKKTDTTENVQETIALEDLDGGEEVKGGGSLVILSDDIDEVESSSRTYNSSK